jgi:hypothetical protein
MLFNSNPMKITCTLIIHLLMSFISSDKPIKWKRLRTVDEVRSAINSQIPPKADIAVVEAFVKKQKLYYHVFEDTLINATSPSRSAGFMISSCWLMTFRFKNKMLTEYEVKEGLTGP